ncbi:MAG TPA: Co2+/Mg2+ efflux protein ApaG [Polyangiaceae bacterium]|nr:Co2+/Mg2+ efflux protein ApaG [Polyangiaceae bacterium]
MSNAITSGIRVTVSSNYIPAQSAPKARRYVFAYTVRIANEGTEAAQLKSRHWIITDGNGKVEEVRGPGVVGEQPMLRPGEHFEYTSGCVLETPRGSMEGTYQMVRSDGAEFDATIAPFALMLPYSLN